MKGLLAVDGGGTKTEFILTDTQGNVLTRNIYAGTNLNSVPLDEAFLTLATGVKSAMNIAQKNNIEIAGAFFGLAGGADERNKGLVYNYFKPKYFSEIPFSNHGDELNATNVGIKDAKDGIVVIGGTGSNVSIKKDGKMLPNPHLSGWGYMFDNGGGGYDYGRNAVIAAKQHINKTGTATQITSMLEEKLGQPVFEGLKDIYSGGPTFVASLAPVVFDACRNRDLVAWNIIKEQANNVAQMINSAHETMGNETPAVVGLVGGIYAHEREILEPLISSQVDDNLTLNFPIESQIYGALMESAKNAGVEITQEFENNFNDTIKNPVLQSQSEEICVEQ